MPERSVEVVYADDIRLEKSEQISLIGVYQSVVNVPSFPFIFPKLCFWFRARTSPEDPFKSVSIVIDDDKGNCLARIDLPSEAFAGQEQATKGFNWEGIEKRFVEIGVNFAISPLVCQENMLIKPSLITERETIKFSTLRIQHESNGSAPIRHEIPR